MQLISSDSDFLFTPHRHHREPSMTPVLSPGFSSSSSSLPSPSITRQLSSSSVQTLADFLVSASTARLAESNVEVVREEGLRHAKLKLDAR